MNDGFDSDVLDYLLNRMDSARRAAFERELERSEAARDALKRGADSLAGFACRAAPPEPMSVDDHRNVLRAIIAATRTDGRDRAKVRGWTWRRVLWPAAALLLLALNLLDFERPLTPDGVHRRIGAGGSRSMEGADEKNASAASSASMNRKSSSGADPMNRDSPSASSGRSVEVEQLRARVAELERSQERSRLDYEQLIRRLAEQAVNERELNRLSTMELVDPGTYSRGERKGLVGIGRHVLTAPGVVTPSEPVPPSGGASSTLPSAPYAWSVFDEKDHRGYLNLYQLPAVAADQALQVWIRPLDTTTYQPVAEVPAPAMPGGAGSVQYVLPATTPAPVEILVTIEPRTATPAVPSGPIVLKGP